jgi:putative ABC transport system ATP-binding protein
MIRVEQVEMVFGLGTPDENSALKHISLTVQAGDFITLIGSNGAGKSTLYNVIAGACIPNRGHIFMKDEQTSLEREITKEAEYKRARYIGRIFQNPLLGTAGKMTLADNMMICHKKGYKSLKISLNKRMRETFREQLRVLDMGLENRLNDNVELFSGGQRQALTLLMTVIFKARLLSMNDPSSVQDALPV